MVRRLFLITLAIILGVCLLVTPASAQQSVKTVPQQATESIHEEIIVQPAQESDFSRMEVKYQFSVPQRVSDLNFTVYMNSFNIINKRGFEQNGKRGFEWDGDEDNPSVTLGYKSTEPMYTKFFNKSADYGDNWALTVIPVPKQWRYWYDYGSDPGYERTISLDHEGVTGEDFAYLGDYERASKNVGGETLEIIISDQSEFPESSIDKKLKGIRSVVNRDLGGSGSPNYIFVLPNEADIHPPNLAIGPNDPSQPRDIAITHDQSNGVQDIWVHEYIHTRQNWGSMTNETSWLNEGAAQFYGGSVNYKLDKIEWNAYAEFLNKGQDSEYSEVILSNPETWEGTRADYDKGALVVAAIDHELRKETNGRATFDDVMLAWANSETFTQQDFEETIEELGGSDVRNLAVEYTTTTKTPEVWDDPNNSNDRSQDKSDSETMTGSKKDTNDSTPGFGIGSGFIAVGITGYMLKRRLIVNTD